MAPPKLSKMSPPITSIPSSKASAFATKSLCRLPAHPSASGVSGNIMAVAARQNRLIAIARSAALALLLAAAIHPTLAASQENPGELLQRQFASAKSALAVGNLPDAENNFRLTIALALRQLGN